jgi:hypothetical protein
MSKNRDPKYRLCSSEHRWAIIMLDEKNWTFLGKYCWAGAKAGTPGIPTFRTHREARLALKTSGYSSRGRVVKVLVSTVCVKYDGIDGGEPK